MKAPFTIRSPMGIRKRLFFLLLVVFVPLLLLEVFIFYRWYDDRKKSEMQANLELARAVGKNFETFLQGLVRSEVGIGLALTASPSITDQHRNSILDTFAANNPAARSVMWLNPDGRVVAASYRPHIGYDLSDRSFFTGAKEGRDWIVSELIIGKETKKTAVTIGCGIRDKQGRLLGVVAFATELDPLDAVLGIVRSGDAGVSLIDNKGMHAYRYPPAAYTWEQRNWIDLYPVIGEVMKGKEVVTIHESKIRGSNRIVAFTPVASIGWVAACSRAESDVIAAILQTILPQALLILLLTLAAFAAAVTFSRRISTSIRRLQDHAAALGKGEVQRLEPVLGPREIKNLAEAFDEMAEKIRLRETALKESKAQLQGILDATRESIWMFSPEGVVLLGNHTALMRMGEMAQEVIGKRFEEVLPPDLAHGRLEHLRGVVESALPTEFEDERAGIQFHHSFYPVLDDTGRVTSVVSFSREITAQKLAEEELRRSEQRYKSLHGELELRVQERTAELERRNQELQNFAFIASHDLNEPLRKIQTFGDLLKAKSADRLGEQERDYISRMTGAANRMQEILDALLRYSRVDTKGQDLTPVKLDDVVKDATDDLEMAIRDVEAQVEIDPLPTVEGDPQQLRQLLQNLIANALKYHRSEVKPLVKIYGETDDGTGRIFVEDNGIGFDEKYLDKIFQPFQRLHGRNEYPGIGMGLAICRKIVERHKGTITAKSTPGRGSTFIITLPVKRGEQ